MATDNSSPALEITEYLQTQGEGTIGATSGWALSTGMEPDAPDNAITVYDTGGQAPDNDDQSIERYTVQVRIRSYGYSSAYAKLQSIKSTLIAASFGSFVAVWAQSEPGLIGKDDNDRFLFTINFEAMRDTGD